MIVVGSGPAGLTAAIYTARAKLKTLVLEAAVMGGYPASTFDIDNYPGFPDGVNGPDLMADFRRQAERFGAEIRMEDVLHIEDSPEGKRLITGDSQYLARSVIIAVGARRRKLEVDGEEEFAGRGVSYCATCDGAFFSGVPVAVVGGGDSAVKEAQHLVHFASKVYLIHRREEFRANQTALDRFMEDQHSEMLVNKIVKRVEGDAIMRRLILEDVKTHEEMVLEVEGLFVSIGLVPSAYCVEGLLKTENGYIVTDGNMESSVPGIFAAGDIRAKKYRQIATAVGDGAAAGMAATDYLKSKHSVSL